uniref:Uncharacterized protein n=1 Tax=Lepeophtheirus salmonis TaxID=72036 RepID=A0A0K2T186_LEPSM
MVSEFSGEDRDLIETYQDSVNRASDLLLYLNTLHVSRLYNMIFSANKLDQFFLTSTKPRRCFKKLFVNLLETGDSYLPIRLKCKKQHHFDNYIAQVGFKYFNISS